MKLISWNVNGFRAVLTKGFEDFLYKENPDIICIQETKMQEGQVDIELLGYEQYYNSAVKKGYSGTAVFTKISPLNKFYGIGIEEFDNEGRVITLEFDSFYLVNVYTPNVKRGLERLEYRMKWEDEFLKYLNKLREVKPIVLCGDLNVAHQEIDIKNPKQNVGNAGFTNEEREKMTILLSNKYIDTYRYLYPEKQEFSWWSYMMNVRSRNIGWRIDYFIVSDNLKNNIENAKIHTLVYGSDHCPIELDLNL